MTHSCFSAHILCNICARALYIYPIFLFISVYQSLIEFYLLLIEFYLLLISVTSFLTLVCLMFISVTLLLISVCSFLTSVTLLLILIFIASNYSYIVTCCLIAQSLKTLNFSLMRVWRQYNLPLHQSSQISSGSMNFGLITQMYRASSASSFFSSIQQAYYPMMSILFLSECVGFCSIANS